ITVNGGTPTYTFVWSNGATTEDLQNLAAGTYSVVVTDANGCEATAVFEVGQENSTIDVIGLTVSTTCTANNGSIDITVNGGTPTYTFVWSNGATTEDLSALPAGTYSVVVTDANGCEATAVFTIDQVSSTLVIAETITNTYCTAENGSIGVLVTGGTTPYSYLWSNGETGDVISGLAAGTYTVVVTDANGCQVTASFDVAQVNNTITLDETIVNTTCTANNGSITLVASGGNAPYTYLWSTGATTDVISGLAAGTYTVVVRDANGCEATASYTVDQTQNTIDVTPIVTNAICTAANGSISLDVQGGSSPYTYAWTGPNGFTSSDKDITGLLPGTYTVTVTDVNGCSNTASAPVNVDQDLVTVDAFVTDTHCSANDGTINLVIKGGTAPYTFQWSNGATTQNLSGLPAGTYTVTLTDANGCTSGATGIVKQVDSELFLDPVITATTCSANNGSITITVTGGDAPYTYQWSNGATTETASGLAAGTYTVVVTDVNGCSTTGSFTVGQNTNTITLDPTIVPTTCVANNGSISIVADGGTAPYSYLWSNGATTSSISNLVAGTYTVVVTDANGCQATGSYEIELMSVVITIRPTAEPTYCEAANGSISIEVGGGTPSYTFAWTGPGGFTSALQNISGLNAGTYSVVVTDANGCSNSIAVDVELVNSTLTLDVSATATFCTANNGTATLTVSGGTAPYQFSWSGPGGFTASTQDISALAAGTYTVVVTDDKGCSATTAVVVPQQNNSITVTGSTLSATCSAASGAISIDVSGGDAPYSYSWTGPGGFSSTDEDLSGLLPGNYTVVVRDVNGCDVSQNFTVGVTQTNINLDANVTQADCTGGNGAIDLTVTGGDAPYTYLWLGPGGNSFSDEDLVNAVAGVYSLTVTDANGCQASLSVNVTQSGNNTPVFDAFGPYCPGTPAPPLPEYSNNGIHGFWQPAAINTNVPGRYTFKFFPYPGQCADQVQIEVLVEGSREPQFDPVGPICRGSGIFTLPTTSKNGITGSWSPAVVSDQNTAYYTFTPAGGQCATAKIIQIVVTDEIVPEFPTFGPFCVGSAPFTLPETSLNGVSGKWYPFQVNTSVAGTFEYSFIPNGGQCAIREYKTQIVITDVLYGTDTITVCENELPYDWHGQMLNAAGVYSTTLNSTQGCDSIVTLRFVVNQQASSEETRDVCEDDVPFTWNGQSITGAGTYTASFTTPTGCDSVATLHVNVHAATFTTVTQTVCSSALPYDWNGNQYNAAGTYSVTLASQFGCDSVVTLQLTVADVVTSTQAISVCTQQIPYNWNGVDYNAAGTYSQTLATANGCDSIAYLVLTVEDALRDTTEVTVCESSLPYNWKGADRTAAGTYSVTEQNAAGCDVISYLILSVNAATYTTTNVTICQSELPYRWNGNSYTAAGVYSVTFNNANGCDSVVTLNLQVPVVQTGLVTETVCPAQLPYVWNGNSYNAAGTYSVTLKNENGCDSTAILNLLVNPVVTSTTRVNVCPAQLPYVWNGNNYTAAGTYTVSLTGANGCDSIATLNLVVTDVVTGATDTANICALELPYTWNGTAYNAAGTYSKTLVNQAGCDSIATLVLTVAPIATATITGPDEICKGESTEITITLTGNGPWLVIYNDGTSNHQLDNITTNVYKFTVTPTQTTTYSLVSVADRKCYNDNLNSAVTVTVYESGSGLRLPTITTKEDTPTQLRGRDMGPGYSYQWSPGVGLSATNIIDPVFRNNSSVDYLINMMSHNGCEVVDSLLVLVEKVPEPIISDLFVPKAWTPNNDGHNDKLTPLLVNIKEIHYFIIYNRWGQKMFETHEKYQGWDGIYNGTPQPQDVYTWVVEGLGEDGKIHKKSGNSVLLR
ncbi:MAG: T9SS type B sorting domain-containing protein, partial [Flavisolibacter sp.]